MVTVVDWHLLILSRERIQMLNYCLERFLKVWSNVLWKQDGYSGKKGKASGRAGEPWHEMKTAKKETVMLLFIYYEAKSHGFSRAVWDESAPVNFSKTTNYTRTTGPSNLVTLWKIYSANLSQIALEIVWLLLPMEAILFTILQNFLQRAGRMFTNKSLYGARELFTFQCSLARLKEQTNMPYLTQKYPNALSS